MNKMLWSLVKNNIFFYIISVFRALLTKKKFMYYETCQQQNKKIDSKTS